MPPNDLYSLVGMENAMGYGVKWFQFQYTEIEADGCPQPRRNFSLPSSLSWVNYDVSGKYNLTIFYNCSSVPVNAKSQLLCSQEHYHNSNTQPSYAFYNYQFRTMASDWHQNCAENLIVPVATTDVSYSYAINMGFYIGISPPDWCADCERSGGQCWSNSTATGCACTNGKSYYRICPPGNGYFPRFSIDIVQANSNFGDLTGTHIGLKIMIGIFSGVGGLLVLATLLCCLRRKTQRNKNRSSINVKEFSETYGCLVQNYNYLAIKMMSNYFVDKLGQGGYGQVFKGKLSDGRPVAVKVLNESKGDGEDFINEVATIGRTNHVNVVTLVGFCIEGTKRALVYEFMSNGFLEKFIYIQRESTTTPFLGWEKLYEIALGIAKGLEYLHRGCNTRILHFDIKPHNILLDQDFHPKISDFGLAKLYPTRESVVSTVGARRTVGYIAPELCCRNLGAVSHKSDVYSYGMMMLEMFGGRKNIDVTVENISEVYFPFWVYNHLMRNNETKEFEDIQTIEVFDDERVKKMIIVALWCIQAHPMERPSITKVVEMLEGNIQEHQMSPNPSVDPRLSVPTL